ncbi:MAG TPA: response regulator [Acidobacteriaceae bacterium]|nr:response regulator [Acidobacteriaceae bacterium]
MPQQTSPFRVLIIDDDEMSRELLCMLLEAEGLTAEAAESGADALEHLKSQSLRPAAVLTDMQMPGMTPEALAGLLRDACGRETVLLAMSGSLPAASTLARFDGFLLKPFTVAEFTGALAAGRAARETGKLGRERTPDSHASRSGILTLAASAEETASNRKMDVGNTSGVGPGASTPAEVQFAPALNEEIYGQLAGSMPREQLHEMYRMCLSDARMRIASMQASVAAKDAGLFIRQAHAIKGASGMLGATELHQMASSLEKCGLDMAQGGVNSLDELASACDRLERMLGARV